MEIMDIISKTIDDASHYKVFDDFSNRLLLSCTSKEVAKLLTFKDYIISSYSVYVSCNIAETVMEKQGFDVGWKYDRDSITVVEIRVLV